ncbi:LlaJI family restriction endonuclease [Halodesulfovibrio aestuarii]|uniref:LlaJI family restriction endonuclease n=1 Tax=Halodesulfovibrio aestuarii TaxID=126333 RepID=UPI003D33FF63
MSKNCFVEGQYYSINKLKESGLSQRIIDIYTSENGRGFKFSFCGFLSSGDEFFVVLPKEQSIPNSLTALATKAGLLAQTFRRYSSENNLDEEELRLLGKSGSQHSNRIATALSLLDDYNRNGLLIRDRTVESNSGQGKIHWGRTINKHLPVYQDGAPFYFDTITRNHSRDSKDMIVLLHRYAIQKCRSTFGWILSPHFESTKTVVPSMPCSDSGALHILRNELDNSFRDRDISVINLLISYFSNAASEADKTTICAYGTKKFYHIWEAVCCTLFNHDRSQMKLVPRPKWVRIVDGVQKIEETVQIPDILFVEKNIRYILDAKYYTHSRSLPGWGDLVKQFYYADTIATDDVKSVRNAMIFPGRHVQLMKYIGYGEIQNRENKPILAFSLNLFSALKSYTAFSSNGYRNTLETLWQ